jgi:hypothetical protein
MRQWRFGAMVWAGLALLAPAVGDARTWEVASDTTNPGQRLTNALLNAQNGDRIHVHAGGPYVAPPGGWRIKRSIDLYGDGAGRAIFQDAGARPPRSTLLVPRTTSDPVLVLDLSEVPAGQSLWNVHVHDLQIAQVGRVPAAAHPTSNGIHLKIENEKLFNNLQLSRLFVYGMGNDGIHLEGKDGKWDPIRVKIEDCHAAFNARHGLYARHVNQLRIEGGGYWGNWNKGAHLMSCPAVHVSGTTFESNQKGGVKADPLAAAQLFVENCGGFQVSGCHFEGFVDNARSGVRTAVTINSPGGYIGDCYFHGVASKPGSTGIHVGWESHSVVVGSNEWSYVDKLVEVADLPTTKSCTVLPQAVTYSTGVASRIVIPDAPDRGHVAVVPTSHTSNVTGGIGVPRISDAVRKAMRPASAGGTLRKGTLVFNETSGKLNYWDGSEWREVTGTAAP